MTMATEYNSGLIVSILFSNVNLLSSLPILDIKALFKYNTSTVDKNIEEDAHAPVPSLITKYGYPCELHKIVTEDGYILEMHRIPKPGAQPVYLQHGVLDSSAAWVMMGPKAALGYLLSDLGYDVWMGNSRGNRYSKHHVTLENSSHEFWDFSWHEIGVYDLPATIDYILENTGFKKLHYVGHSQGTTIFWVMCSERPEYNDKILSMQALAPIAYLNGTRSPFIVALVYVLGTLNTMSKFLCIKRFLPHSQYLVKAGIVLSHETAITRSIYSHIIFLIAGYNSQEMNPKMLPVIFGHIPSGASVKQMFHFGQIRRSGIFRQFDYGMFTNWRKYGQIKPPKYDLSKVKAPVYFFYSENDWLADTTDINLLYSELGNPQEKYLVTDQKFNHLDFLWATNVKSLLYDKVLDVMQNIDKEHCLENLK